jgi:hypothetical protein
MGEKKAAKKKAKKKTKNKGKAKKIDPKPIMTECDCCNGSGEMQEECTRCGEGLTEANVVLNPPEFDVDQLDLCKKCYEKEKRDGEYETR